MSDLECDEITKVVIFKAAGSSFCGGYDLKEIEAFNWQGKKTDPNVTRRAIRMSVHAAAMFSASPSARSPACAPSRARRAAGKSWPSGPA